MQTHCPSRSSLLLGFMLLCFLSASAQYNFQKSFGGPNDDLAMSVIQTRKGDYLMAGRTYSFGKGKSDAWIVKTDIRGQELWRKAFGGPGSDRVNAVIENAEGNYMVVGSRQKISRKTKKLLRASAWIIELDENGEEVWSAGLGDTGQDEFTNIIQTADGGYAIAGYTTSKGAGKSDIWLVRLDGNKKLLWQKFYGGTESEGAHSLIETRDGDFVVAGSSSSYGKGSADILLIKINPYGRLIWKKPYGGSSSESVKDIIETSNGDYLLAGWTASGTESDGHTDAILMRVDVNGNGRWKNRFGEGGSAEFNQITKTQDGNYALIGSYATDSQTPSKVWFMKVSEDGRVVAQRKFPGKRTDTGNSISATRDGGLVMAGATKSYSKGGGNDIWLIKTDSEGKLSKMPEPEPEPEDTPVMAEVEVPTSDPAQIDPSGDFAKNADDMADYLKPNLYILTVGVSEFDQSEANLTFAHTDAKSISDKFETLQGSLFNKVITRKLLNQEATLLNIKMGISWLEREATQKDVILIFISSHGALDHKGNLFILPTDFNAFNLFATALNIKDLTEGMNGTPCKKLILLDACHSGQSGNDLLEFATAKALNLNNTIKELLDKEPGLTVMTSSSGKEYSYENPSWGHGAFTKAILEGLDGNADFNKNSVVSLMELNLYVTDRVKELTGGRQHPYTPINLFGDIPLFVLDRY